MYSVRTILYCYKGQRMRSSAETSALGVGPLGPLVRMNRVVPPGLVANCPDFRDLQNACLADCATTVEIVLKEPNEPRFHPLDRCN